MYALDSFLADAVPACSEAGLCALVYKALLSALGPQQVRSSNARRPSRRIAKHDGVELTNGRASPTPEWMLCPRMWSVGGGRVLPAAEPTFRTCRMPLITRLSSTRGLPGWPWGRCGSIRAQASSESQNSRAIAILLRWETQFRKKTQAVAIGCMSSLPKRGPEWPC